MENLLAGQDLPQEDCLLVVGHVGHQSEALRCVTLIRSNQTKTDNQTIDQADKPGTRKLLIQVGS